MKLIVMRSLKEWVYPVLLKPIRPEVVLELLRSKKLKTWNRL